MKETRSGLKALEKDLVETLGLNSYMWENGKGAGFWVQVEGLTFDRRKKEGIGADTILFKIWWQEIESSHMMVIFSMKQEARSSAENEWTVGKLNVWYKYYWAMLLLRGQVRLVIMNFSWYQSRQHIKEQRHHFADKGPYNQSYGFSSRYVWMWELDHKKCWVLKKWCFQIVCWRRLLGVPWTARR